MSSFADTRRPLEKVLEVAQGAEQKSDGSYMCVCPAHEDNNPSLHITEDSSGKLALHCFKGCRVPLICHAWGMTQAELFPDFGQPNRNGQRNGQASGKNGAAKKPAIKGSKVAEYDYLDADSARIYQAVRYETEDGHKTFVQRRPNGQNGWIPNMRGVDRVLYRLPELIAAGDDKSIPVYLVEGEKKVEALRSWGLVATCNVGGAGKWLAAYNTYLRDRNVIILPDNDPIDPQTGACPGLDHARKIITNLRGVANSVRVIELPGLPSKGDVVDWIADGGTLDQFLQVVSDPSHEIDPVAVHDANKAAKRQKSGIDAGLSESLLDSPESLLDPEQQTEVNLSRRFAAMCADRLNYVPEWSKFLHWSGLRWSDEAKQPEIEFAKEFANQVWLEAQRHEPEEHERDKVNPLSALAKKVGTKKFIFDMISLVKSDPSIVTASDRLDTSPALLNVLNGTIDLRAGALVPHRREDYITKHCPYDFNPDATCPRWEDFIYQVMSNDTELVNFLQTWFGYCLTGETREHKVPIFWGSGGNGKSVLLNTIMKVIGEDYGHVAPPNLLLDKNRDEHPTILAALFGKRLVVCSETGDGAKLNEALLKSLSGGDKITARKLYQDFWEFEPSHKLVLLTNHKPAVRGTDSGIWRRLVMIPFTQRFWDESTGETPGTPETKQDKDLAEKLMEEAPGILSWLIRGAKNWYENGLDIPTVARNATKEYRSAEDVIQRFIDERCLESPGLRAKSAVLYKSYKKWATSNGEYVLTKNKFGRMLGEKHKHDESDPRWYVGIDTAVLDDDDEN